MNINGLSPVVRRNVPYLLLITDAPLRQLQKQKNTENSRDEGGENEWKKRKNTGIRGHYHWIRVPSCITVVRIQGQIVVIKISEGPALFVSCKTSDRIYFIRKIFSRFVLSCKMELIPSVKLKTNKILNRPLSSQIYVKRCSK